MLKKFTIKIKGRAFSLIELSIVILIIGILVAGVTQSTRLIYQMRLSSARSLTQSSPVASIKGLLLWLETTSENSFLEAEAEDGAELSLWQDINPQSTSKVTMIPSGSNLTGMTYLAKGINGLPSINFRADSNRAFVSSANLISSGYASTVFIVYKLTTQSLGSDQYPFQWDSSYLRAWNEDRYLGTSTVWLIGAAAFTNNPEIARITLTGGTASDRISLHVNGTSVISPYALSGSAITGSSPFRVAHANPGFGQENFDGQISEIIVFEGVLKASDAAAVEKYLEKKYGIAVVN
jgi:prepilin-type N-terminal cleavage/methylation domain-containing protein